MINILYIDGNIINIETFKALLWNKETYSVHCYLDFKQALYHHSQNFINFDIIFINIDTFDHLYTPESFIEICRQQGSMWRLPIILIGTYMRYDKIVNMLVNDINDYMLLPFTTSMLVCKIKQCVLRKDKIKILFDIIPEDIIEIIQKKKDNNMAIKRHQNIIVLFSDIVNYTTISSKWTTERVIYMLNKLFTEFDIICQKYKVYKVETIGDAYMIVSDIKEEKVFEDDIETMIKVASEMIYVAEVNVNVKIRVGMHCGPACSGVIGLIRPRYSFFGDTINTASRMESTGFPMCTQVSESFYKAMKDKNMAVSLGNSNIKGKGKMNTYLLKNGNWKETVCTTSNKNNPSQSFRRQNSTP